MAGAVASDFGAMSVEELFEAQGKIDDSFFVALVEADTAGLNAAYMVTAAISSELARREVLH